MFKFKIICVGKLKETAFKELEGMYLKRLTPFAKVSLTELAEVGYKENDDPEKVMFKEAESIAKHISDDSVLVVLDPRGVERNSVDFAKFVERLGSIGKELCFVIGGSLGVHESILNSANHKISLSQLTFTHNFARILLEEQLYRACSILSNRAYHK